MPVQDRYKFLSRTKLKVATPEDVLKLVRATWPGACAEGSSGVEYSWACKLSEGHRLVAHSWSHQRDAAWFWVRIAATLAETADADNLHEDARIPRGSRA